MTAFFISGNQNGISSRQSSACDSVLSIHYIRYYANRAWPYIMLPSMKLAPVCREWPGRQASGESPRGLRGGAAGAPLSTAGSGGFVNVPKDLGSIGTAGSNPGSFNPFDLPSPTYASPVPKHVDNSFAEFSPVAGAPLQPRIPNPMR